jgi:hypothetical protein
MASGELAPGRKCRSPGPEKIPMSEYKPDPRDAALKNFRNREEETRRVAAEHERTVNNRARSQQENLSLWSTSAFQAVSLGVRRLSDDFARRESHIDNGD